MNKPTVFYIQISFWRVESNIGFVAPKWMDEWLFDGMCYCKMQYIVYNCYCRLNELFSYRIQTIQISTISRTDDIEFVPFYSLHEMITYRPSVHLYILNRIMDEIDLLSAFPLWRSYTYISITRLCVDEI